MSGDRAEAHAAEVAKLKKAGATSEALAKDS